MTGFIWLNVQPSVEHHVFIAPQSCQVIHVMISVALNLDGFGHDARNDEGIIALKFIQILHEI